MTPDQATVIAGFLLPEIEQEVATTARVIAAVPDDRKDYAPDAKSTKAGALAEHIAGSDIWFLEAVLNAGFGTPPQPTGASSAELAARYTERATALLKQIADLPGEHLSQTVTFFTWELPNVTFLSFMQKHSVHHRGQLCAYLRPMGARVPSIYGGSADEPMTASAGDGN